MPTKSAEQPLDRLTEVYRDPNERHTARAELDGLKMTDKEDFHKFVTKFMHPAQRAQLSTRDYVYEFKKRLPYRLQTHLAATPVCPLSAVHPDGRAGAPLSKMRKALIREALPTVVRATPPPPLRPNRLQGTTPRASGSGTYPGSWVSRMPSEPGGEGNHQGDPGVMDSSFGSSPSFMGHLPGGGDIEGG
ncbi:hypothetical protein E4U58_003631 [Claviceps cyperi]|nr:hypothetical protein E4U58_003631 [Claviceps cyperi]